MARRISDASEECLVLPCALNSERGRLLSDPDAMRRPNRKTLDASRFATNSAERYEHMRREGLFCQGRVTEK